MSDKIDYFLDPSEKNYNEFEASIRALGESMKPGKFTGNHNDVRVYHKKVFVTHCSLIEESYNIAIPAKSLTLYDFLAYLENIKEKRQRESMKVKQNRNGPNKS